MTSRAATASPAPVAPVEFMRLWEEGYVRDPVSFSAMHVKIVAIVDGATLRTPDGAWDADLIHETVRAGTAAYAGTRSRLLRSPLGLTPPAWVPARGFDVREHVVLSSETLTLSGATLPRLSGVSDGQLDIARPLWRIRFTALTDGRVAIGLLLHHSAGDALWAGSFFTALTTAVDAPALEVAEPDLTSGARSPLDLLTAALRTWRAGEGARGASLRGRARRVAARVLRPARSAYLSATGAVGRLPHQHSDLIDLDASVVKQAARALGAGATEVMAAATIRSSPTGEAVVALRVPSSRRGDGDDARNLVTDDLVAGRATDDLGELARSIAQRRTAEVDTTPADAARIGYATIIPWRGATRLFAGSEVLGIYGLPAAMPWDEVTTFAIIYRGTVHLVATTVDHIDVRAVLASITSDLATAVASPAPAASEVASAG